jgi:hypothetical protein
MVQAGLQETLCDYSFYASLPCCFMFAVLQAAGSTTTVTTAKGVGSVEQVQSPSGLGSSTVVRNAKGEVVSSSMSTPLGQVTSGSQGTAVQLPGAAQPLQLPAVPGMAGAPGLLMG